MGGSQLRGRSVARIVKLAVEAAGLDPAGYAGRSLRAGFTTSAAAAGKPERTIMAVTGHKSQMMLRKYIRALDPFAESAARGLL